MSSPNSSVQSDIEEWRAIRNASLGLLSVPFLVGAVMGPIVAEGSKERFKSWENGSNNYLLPVGSQVLSVERRYNRAVVKITGRDGQEYTVSCDMGDDTNPPSCN